MHIRGSYIIDTSDPRQLAGDAGYVFVATVEDYHTEYLDPATLESESGGTKVVKNPYTSYTVQVIENIKGELTTAQPISLLKRGGLAENKRAYYIFENDFLPEVGGTYIFYAYGQKDGSLLVSGPNSNVEVTLPNSVMRSRELSSENMASLLKDSPEYQAACTAYENEIVVVERTRYPSVYDAAG